MANISISQLAASAANLAAADLIPVVQTAGIGPVKMTGTQLMNGIAITGTGSTTSRSLNDRYGTALQIDVRDFGMHTGNSASTNTQYMNTAIERASVLGADLVFSENYGLNANVYLPTGDDRINLVGNFASPRNPGVTFTGAAVDKGFHIYDPLSATGEYPFASCISGLYIAGTNGATRGVTFTNVNHPVLNQCIVDGFAGAGVEFYDFIRATASYNWVKNCGSASECMVVFSGADGGGGGSTTLYTIQNRVSNPPGTTGNLGGISVDRVATYTMIGDAIESVGGDLLRIGSRASSSRATQSGRLIGLNLENPTNGKSYIVLGKNWSGSDRAVMGLSIQGVTGFPSGTTSLENPTDIDSVRSLNVDQNTILVGVNGSTLQHWKLSSNTINTTIEQCPQLESYAWPWVKINGTWQKDAGPYVKWTQGQVAGSTQTKTMTGVATMSALVNTDQGSYHQDIGPYNPSVAQDITNITDIPENAIVWLRGNDTNTTLKNLANGTDGALRMAGGADVVTTVGAVYGFRKSSTYLEQFA